MDGEVSPTADSPIVLGGPNGAGKSTIAPEVVANRRKTHTETVKASRDLAGIEAAVRRAVTQALDERRKLGLPIVGETKPAQPKHGAK